MLHRQLRGHTLGEGGDTLIELLIAIVIISLSVTALLGMLITSLTSSAEHRSLADLDTVVKSFAESATYQVQQKSRTDAATVTSGSDSVADTSILASDQGKTVTGTGIPTGTYVGSVTTGTGFLLSSSTTSQVNVNATANGSSVTIAEAQFADCASVAGTSYNGGPPIPYVPPPNYLVVFKSVQYWDSANDQFDSTSCGSNDHTGYQLLTVTGTAPSGVTETISFGVRAP